MARPKKEKYEIEERYVQEALRLAACYHDMILERKYMEDVLNGRLVYTTEMAIADLSGGGVSYDTERVQTSNISKPAERIGILLADGFVERRNRELQEEVLGDMDRYHEICRDMDIVETAIRERMTKRTAAVFRCLYVERTTFSRVRDEYRNRMANEQIIREREKALQAIAEEVESAEIRLAGKEDTWEEKRKNESK